MASFPDTRLRRLRTSATLRDMLASVHVRREQLIAPLFVREGSGIEREISAMPGQFQYSVDKAMETLRRWRDLGLRAALLFGIPGRKDAIGSGAWDGRAPVQRLLGQMKKHLPDMLAVTDVCLCEYTDHGHCGVLKGAQSRPASSARPRKSARPGLPAVAMNVDNDATLELLARTALSHARAGADIVAPSAMMDGQVAAIRSALDAKGFEATAIMSYSVKFASCMYGPFREAAGSAPRSGDRRSYQMDYRSPSQAAQEAARDLAEGADIIMVKPAATYLDVLADLRRRFDAPLAAYHVSGEYSAIKAAAKMGYLDERSAVLEVTSAIRRAGADLIITYFAPQLAQWL